MKSTFSTLFLTSLGLIAPAGAAIIASTDFDGRILDPSNTATNMNWSVNGVNDPGGIPAFLADGTTPLPLFDDNPLVQNIFAPALNTGNSNTFWNADVALTPSGAPIIEVGQVSFDYWAISGGQAQNVDRLSDFIVSLLDPSSALLATASIEGVLNGTNSFAGVGTPVTLTFESPVSLSEPGTYTLRIQGGNIFNNYTGNHTAIDNLSINVPEPSVALLGALGLMGLLRRRR